MRLVGARLPRGSRRPASVAQTDRPERPTIRLVSAWRRRAIEAFPELRRELDAKGEVFSVYALWFELLPLAREAHRENNEDLLHRIYDFAEWCDRHGGELSNAVGVSFYEHLFDERWMRPLVVPWLTGKIIRNVWPLWEARLSPEEMREVDGLLRRSGAGDPR
jgi:hypothetical protein